MAAKQNTVELLIRARDETQRAIKSAENGLERFAAAQARTAARRNQFSNLEKQARDLAGQYDVVSNRVSELGKRLGAAKRPSAALKAEFAASRAEAKRLKDEVIAVAVAAGRMNGRVGKQGSFAAFDRGIDAKRNAEQAAASVDRLGRAIALAAANQARLNRISSYEQFARTAKGANVAERAIKTETAALNQNTAALSRNAAATRVQGAAKGQAAGQGDLAARMVARTATRTGAPVKFGLDELRPYQMQNLGYQVNDVISGLAMGQKPMQVFTQQAGQILQIFPKTVGAILRLAPVLGLVTATFSPFISAMMKANAEAKTLKEFDLLLTRSGNAANYTAPKLAALAASLDAYSGSLKDARAALTQFVDDAVDPAYLERFGRASLDLAKVMGKDVAEAANQVSTAFTGNADAILALDDELKFLTKSENDYVKLLREQKRDAEARTFAFSKFEERMGETAAKMRGPWTTILSNFGSAWDAFVEKVNFADFSQIKAEVSGLIDLLAKMTGMLPGARSSTIENIDATLARNRERIADLARETTTARGRNNAGNAFAGAPIASLGVAATEQRNAAEIRRIQAENQFLETRRVILAAQQPGGGLLGPPPDPSDTTTRPPPPANTPSGGRGASEAERLAKARAEFLKSLDAENDARRFQLTLVDQEERQRRIVEEIQKKSLQAAELGLELSAAQTREIRETTGALYDAEMAQKALQMIEATRLELAQARGEIESREDFVNRKLREAGFQLKVLDEATGEWVSTLVRGGDEYAEQQRQLYDIVETTRKRVAAEKEVNDLTSMRADLMEQILFYEDAGQQARADQLREQLVGVNAELLKAVDAAILFWTEMGGDGADAALLKLRLTRDQLNGLGETAIVSGRQINEMLAGGLTGAFDQFIQAVGEGENVLRSLANAFRQFAADFLREIGQMIMKQAFLNALQGMGGGGGGKPGMVGQGFGKGISGWINSLFRHGGGMVGSGGGYRATPAHHFNQALRYHNGGIAGLKPNEVPAVLERGEEVLTADDPRHRYNGGSQSQGASMKVVNVFDAADLLDKALASDEGERVFLNFVRKNPGAFKAAMG